MQDQATGNMIVVLIQTTVIKKTKQTERIKPRISRGFLLIQHICVYVIAVSSLYAHLPCYKVTASISLKFVVTL
jgi:hypothetical protein